MCEETPLKITHFVSFPRVKIRQKTLGAVHSDIYIHLDGEMFTLEMCLGVHHPMFLSGIALATYLR
jgi:hypothetical protein